MLKIFLIIFLKILKIKNFYNFSKISLKIKFFIKLLKFYKN